MWDFMPISNPQCDRGSTLLRSPLLELARSVIVQGQVISRRK